MWAVFRKSDGKLVATSPAAAGAANKKAALEEVARGLEGAPPLSDFDAVEVDDEVSAPIAPQRFSRMERTVRFVAGGKAELVSDTPEEATVTVTIDATQLHPVDKVPLIPGDGTSFVAVTLQKMALNGKPMTSPEEDNDVIWLRTDHGALRQNKGDLPQEIRSVKLESGAASFRIYSEKAKRLATVQMLSENPTLSLPAVKVEFT